MIAKARQTLSDMQQAEIEERERRASDPVERAKLALQRAGQRVFIHSLLSPGSTLLVVGNRTMTADEMIAHAERFGRW
jgi:hypothetical protein